jgi:hypothetical protein
MSDDETTMRQAAADLRERCDIEIEIATAEFRARLRERAEWAVEELLEMLSHGRAGETLH